MTAVVEPGAKVPRRGKAPESVPPDIADKIRRGRVAMRKDAMVRRLCVKFWQGEHYWYLNSKRELKVLPTALVDASGAKPGHRIRNVYNFAHSIVESKVSAASQRVPGYEIDPASTDPQDYSGARLAQQVAYYGYDKWRLRRHTTKTITNALVQREGFILPYFDQNVGPFKDGVGRGELKFLNLTRSEVMWEPGVDFDDSPWWGIERAMLKEEVKYLPGFVGGELKSDAQTGDTPEAKRSDEMTVTTMFFERPCPKHPEGRFTWVNNNRVICDYRLVDPEASDWWEPYPLRDAQDMVVDEPIIHRLSYTVDPEGDDRGLMEHLVDLTRTVDDCWNKLLEWKNRCLLPQMTAPKGSNVQRRDDTPGATWTYNVIGGMKPEWEKTPPVPHELFQMLELAIQHMRAIAADVDVQPEPDLAAKTISAAIENNRSKWQSFLGDLAEFHSRLMRHCLTLVARHYDEARVIAIRGQYGWEPSQSFTGQDMLSQINVRVRPGSLEAESRAQSMQKIQFVQQLWPGAISPEAALAVMEGSPAEGLLKSYEQHAARAWKLCLKLAEGPQAMLAYQPRTDFEFGDPAQGFQVPGWMPRKVDNIAIWKTVVADFMCTDQYDQFPAETQHIFDTVYAGLEFLEQRRAMNIAMKQQSEAAALGMGNAAAPQGQPAMPSPSGVTAEQSAPDAGTPQQ